jgi:hypothetical protein
LAARGRRQIERGPGYTPYTYQQQLSETAFAHSSALFDNLGRRATPTHANAPNRYQQRLHANIRAIVDAARAEQISITADTDPDPEEEEEEQCGVAAADLGGAAAAAPHAHVQQQLPPPAWGQQGGGAEGYSSGGGGGYGQLLAPMQPMQPQQPQQLQQQPYMQQLPHQLMQHAPVHMQQQLPPPQLYPPQYPQQQQPPSWLANVNASVSGLLRTVGLGEYEQLFRDSAIDMAALELLSRDDLKELGLPLGAIVKVQAALREHQQRRGGCGG